MVDVIPASLSCLKGKGKGKEVDGNATGVVHDDAYSISFEGVIDVITIWVFYYSNYSSMLMYRIQYKYIVCVP